MAKRRGETENGNLRVKKPRMKWTDDLHQSFLDAVAILGGEDYATPKLISSIMRSKDVTTLNIKSHLQMYRNLRQRHLIQDVLEASDSQANKKQVLNKINEVLDHPAPQRHQPRLRQIKKLIAGTSLENHHQPPPPILESSSNIFTVRVHGKEGQRPHAYMIVGELMNPSTTQADQGKGKEKMPTEQDHRTMQEFHNNLLKKCKYNWASSLKTGD